MKENKCAVTVNNIDQVKNLIDNFDFDPRLIMINAEGMTQEDM